MIYRVMLLRQCLKLFNLRRAMRTWLKSVATSWANLEILLLEIQDQGKSKSDIASFPSFVTFCPFLIALINLLFFLAPWFSSSCSTASSHCVLPQQEGCSCQPMSSLLTSSQRSRDTSRRYEILLLSFLSMIVMGRQGWKCVHLLSSPCVLPKTIVLVGYH